MFVGNTASGYEKLLQ